MEYKGHDNIRVENLLSHLKAKPHMNTKKPRALLKNIGLTARAVPLKRTRLLAQLMLLLLGAIREVIELTSLTAPTAVAAGTPTR